MVVRSFNTINVSIISASLILPSGCSGISKKDNIEKTTPNILFISTDQQNVNSVSAHGNPWLKTPNQDFLVRNGISFLNSYCTSPVSGPSRSSLLTGRMPHETGVNYNDGSSINESIPTFGEVLKAAGYETVWAGKWHLPEPYPTRRSKAPLSIRGFDFLEFYDPEVSQTDWGFGGKTDKPLADAAVEYINGYESSKPFLLCVSFHNPHDICHVPRIPDKYPNPDSSVELPPLPLNHSIQVDEPEIIANSRKREYYGNELLLSQKNDEKTWRSYMWYYYRMTEEVDVQIGRLLQAIKDKGIEENTVVIFTSDHGDGMAEKKWAAKLSVYEGPAKVPCIIYYKDKIPSQGVNLEYLVSGIDIFPTILDFAGVEIPDHMNGTSLKSILEHPDSRTKEFVVTELAVDTKDHSLTGRMIRTKEYKYNIYSKGNHNEELFDLINDPLEMTNMANDENMQKVKNDLIVKLKHWMVKTEDPFLSIAKF